MEIYLVRHGQTEYNLKGIVQGRGVDSSLNKTGKRQAEAFYQAYRDTPFDLLYISALKRTQETMQSFIESGLRHEVRPAIDEINWGIYEGVGRDPIKHKRYLDIIGRWQSGEYGIRIDGGESAEDLSNRVQTFVDELRTLDAKRVLVCSHGRTIRVLMCLLTDTPLQNMDEFGHSNTALYKLRFDGNSFHVLMSNNISHLDEKR